MTDPRHAISLFYAHLNACSTHKSLGSLVASITFTSSTMRSSKTTTALCILFISSFSTLFIHSQLSISSSNTRELFKTSFRSTTTKSNNKQCPSLYKQQNTDNEHSPLIFEDHDLLVCRTPKVGSLELRGIAAAYHEDTPYQPLSLNRPYTNHTLSDIQNIQQFQHYLYNDAVKRVMFVRHPVNRILSGFLEVARFRVFWTKIHGMRRNLGTTPNAFGTWITSGAFRQHYQSTCNEYSTQQSLHRAIQHWAPPQHCRCGVYECGVEWQVYKIEDYGSIGSVLSKYLPEKYLPASTTNKTLHKRSYKVRDYLAPKTLEILNEATREEQEFFGYKPLTINDLS